MCCQLLIVAGYFCPNGEAVNSSSACRAACSVGGWWRSAAGWQRPFVRSWSGTMRMDARNRVDHAAGDHRVRPGLRRPPRAGPTRPSQQTISTSRTPRFPGLGAYLGPERGALSWSQTQMPSTCMVHRRDRRRRPDRRNGRGPGGSRGSWVRIASREDHPARALPAVGTRQASTSSRTASVMLRGSSRATAPCRSCRPHGGVWASPDRHTGPRPG